MADYQKVIAEALHNRDGRRLAESPDRRYDCAFTSSQDGHPILNWPALEQSGMATREPRRKRGRQIVRQIPEPIPAALEDVARARTRGHRSRTGTS